MGKGLCPPPPPGYATERNTFFPISGGDLRSDVHQSQIIGEDADVDHTQILGGMSPPPPPPPGFQHP